VQAKAGDGDIKNSGSCVRALMKRARMVSNTIPGRKSAGGYICELSGDILQYTRLCWPSVLVQVDYSTYILVP
jgi:hypothetical protein